MLTSSEERSSLTIFWKIKNFSYCWTDIRSSEFYWKRQQFQLALNPKSLECDIFCLDSFCRKYIFGQITLLKCDGSKEESSVERRINYLNFSPLKNIIFGERRDAFLPKDTLTIRCRLDDNDQRPSGGKVYIYSTIGVKRSCFLWTLNDVSLQYTVKKISVENSDLYGSIQLTISSSGGINSDEQFYIEVSRSGGESCYSVLKISVLDSDGKAINYVSDEYVFEKEDRQQVWRFPPFIRKKALENMLTALSLKCDFAITVGKVTDQTAVYSYFNDVIPLIGDSEEPSKCLKGGSVSKPTTDLEKNLKTILDNGILSDVDLQSGSEVIQAHRNILSARSPVFKAMFTKDMKEAISKTVVIEDLNVETVKRMLRYMYTDTIHDYQWGNILSLYIAASKYEVLSLKEKCSSFLKENLSPSNVCEVLVLADSHQDQGLLSSVHDFISKYDSEFFASESWKEFEKSNSSLALKTLREIKSTKL